MENITLNKTKVKNLLRDVLQFKKYGIYIYIFPISREGVSPVNVIVHTKWFVRKCLLLHAVSTALVHLRWAVPVNPYLCHKRVTTLGK